MQTPNPKANPASAVPKSPDEQTLFTFIAFTLFQKGLFLLFRPTNPQNKAQTQAELRDWEMKRAHRAKLERRENFHYWITTALAVLAFILSVASLSWQVYKDLHPTACTTCASAQPAQPE